MILVDYFLWLSMAPLIAIARKDRTVGTPPSSLHIRHASGDGKPAATLVKQYNSASIGQALHNGILIYHHIKLVSCKSKHTCSPIAEDLSLSPTAMRNHWRWVLA